MHLEKYSIGIGDRFGREGVAQLTALKKAKDKGITIVPVWNKSKREHDLIGSSPIDARIEADNAVKTLGWKDSYYVDADHIGVKTVDNFVEHCNFFTIDVADFIGKEVSQEEKDKFIKHASGFSGKIEIENLSRPFEINIEKLNAITGKYLGAIKEASTIYKKIKTIKGNENFIAEVSLDENEQAQTPEELFFILLGLSLENIPVQTIAPKFTGRFNKGVDYVGNVEQFAREFEDDVIMIKFAVQSFNLPTNLKLSIHSGSDKFSLYNPIKQVIKKYNCGLHLKTAGTTWLEELIGLAEASGDGLLIAKDIYQQAYNRIDEMMKPYLTVVDINTALLPKPDEVWKWESKTYVNNLRHNQSCTEYNIHFRQLLHLAYKIAAEMGKKYLDAIEENKMIIAKNVTENLFDRHISKLFLND